MSLYVCGLTSSHDCRYKATLRRNGNFRIDMNEELAEPILGSVSTRWEQVLIMLGTIATFLTHATKAHLTSSDIDVCIEI